MSGDLAAADGAAFPRLGDIDLETLRRFGRVESVPLGTVLQREGDIPRDFYVVVSGSIDVVVHIEGRVTGAGELIVVPHEAFRRMIATEPELSDIILRAFVGRRRAMISMPA